MRVKNESSRSNRRNFIGTATAAFAGFTILPVRVDKATALKNTNDSRKLELEEHTPVFNVCEYGLVGDGVTMNTVAFQDLINSCAKNGGGTLFFPAGDFLSGTIQIKSNINLYLSGGATIWGSTVRSDYKHGCLIYAEDAENISIVGMGAIDGNGSFYWGEYLQKINEDEMVERMTWRPDCMLKFIRCNNLILNEITIRNSPSWTIHPMDCERVTIKGISILNGIFEEDGPNTDGINPDGCSKVRISDCYLQCGDDCIVLKITDRPGGNKICRDIVVTNCVLITSETALKIGSETHGEFRNIAFSNCVIHDSGSGFGLQMRDGGLIDGMVVNNITVDNTKMDHSQGIFIWSHRRTDKTPWGTIKNVLISNMTISGAAGIFISGAKEKHIEGLTLENIRINIIKGNERPLNDNPPDPFHVFGHKSAPYSMFCRYVDNLILRNIQFDWVMPENPEWGSALRCWHAKNLRIESLVARQSLSSKLPSIDLKDVKGAFITNCLAPEETGTVLKIEEGTEQVTLIGNEFSRAKKLYELGKGGDAKEIFEISNRLPV